MTTMHPNSPGAKRPIIKQQPAPGQSPVGGTTSLPQNLSTPPNTAGRSPTDGSQPGAGGTTDTRGTPSAGGSTTTSTPPVPPAAPVPATIPPGAVPPPPPVAAPAPAPGNAPPSAEDPNAGRNKEMGDKLFEELMKSLNESSRYGSEQAQATRDQGYSRLDDERRLAEDRAKADAAKRGVYNGTPLTNSLGDIGERYLRGGSDLETNIQRDQAQRAMEDKQRAIEMIFKLGDAQRLDQQGQDDLWLKLLEMGLVGGPTIPGAMGDMPTGV